jgi:hypothetical protein
MADRFVRNFPMCCQIRSKKQQLPEHAAIPAGARFGNSGSILAVLPDLRLNRGV